MSDYDAVETTTHATHGKAKKDAVVPKEPAHEKKPPVGVDSTKTGQALDHLLKADQALSAVRAVTSAMATKASRDKAAALEMKPLLVPHHDAALAELDATWMLLNHNTGEEADRRHVPNEDIKAEELAHPGMHAAAEKVTRNLAEIVVDIDTIAGIIPEHQSDIQNVTGGLIGSLRHVRANLGLEAKGYGDLLKMVSITVHANTVWLGSGDPRLQIDEAVVVMAQAFDRSTSTMMLAIKKTIDIISKEEVAKHDGVLDFMWDKAKEMMSKVSEAVSGVAWPITLADKAVGKILEYQSEAQKKLIGADLDNYVASIEKQGDDLELAARAENGSTDVIALSNALDRKFNDLGKNNPDAWKRGDGAVAGTQAEFLRSITRGAQKVHASVPTTRDLVFQFLTGFVNANSKERASSGRRSPFEGSTYRDGYVHVDLKLERNALVGGWMLLGDTATLHCPNAESIAPQLMANSNGFSLAQLDTDLVIDIEVTDGSRDALPGLWGDDRVRTIRLDRNHMLTNQGAASVWNWLQTYTHHTADEILSAVTKIQKD